MRSAKTIIMAAKAVSVVSTPFYLPVVALASLLVLTYLNLLPVVYKLTLLVVFWLFTVFMPTMLIRLYRRYQYLLRNAVIDHPNQAWSIDITYIPIKHGFLYLTAVIDWYSRCIVGWEVDDTLDTRMVITALKKAFMVAKPVILNSDQGCQFTSNEYMNFLKENQIRQSMDGKSRWADNIMIERWFRSFKYEEAYLTQYNNIREARKAIGKYVHTYNFERCHSALNNQTPASCYYPILLLDDHAA